MPRMHVKLQSCKALLLSVPRRRLVQLARMPANGVYPLSYGATLNMPSQHNQDAVQMVLDFEINMRTGAGVLHACMHVRK